MKKSKKNILIVFAFLLCAGVVWHFTVVDVTYHGDRALKKYYEYYGSPEEQDNIQLKRQQMLSELGDYDNYTLNMRKRLVAIFESEGLTLVGEYSKENYLKQKEYIITHYKFATADDQEMFKYDLDDKSAFEFDINKWHFYILNEDFDSIYYGYYVPENFRMVAFNDTDCKIAFLTFGDSDQDCFGENNDEKDLQEFVCESFRYNFKK